MRGENVLQQFSQCRDVPLSVSQVPDETLLGLLPGGLESLVERPVRFHDLQILVQDHERLPHRFYNGFGEVKTALGGINIDQHHHGAVDLPVWPRGRQDAERIPAAVRVADITRFPIAALHGIQQ